MTWKPWPAQKALVEILKRREPRILVIPAGGYNFPIQVDSDLPPGTVEFRYGDRVVGRIENVRPD